MRFAGLWRHTTKLILIYCVQLAGKMKQSSVFPQAVSYQSYDSLT